MAELTSATPTSARSFARMFPTPFLRHYVAWKLRLDPVYRAMAKELAGTSLPVLDLGCGVGIFSFYLRQQGFRAPILGVDFDESKIQAAQSVAAQHFPDVSFQIGDVSRHIPDHAGSVTILDILQYFHPSQRRVVLETAAQKVVPGGKLLIRSGLLSRNWRCRFTKAIDRFATSIRWMRSERLEFPTREEIVAPLQEAGLTGRCEPLSGRLPFHNWLFSFSR